MKKIITWLSHPPLDAPRATLLIRVIVGGIFLSEGILKLVYKNQGLGRFTKLGFPLPELTANFVAGLEIAGGLLVLVGFCTRWIALPFIAEMIVAFLSTKIALYLGTSPLAPPSSPPLVGPWAVLHEARSEYAQLLGSLFLLIVGPGAWSLDALRARRMSITAEPRLAAGAR